MADPILSLQSRKDSPDQTLNISQNNKAEKAKGTMSLKGAVTTGIAGLLLSVGMPEKATTYQNVAMAAGGITNGEVLGNNNFDPTSVIREHKIPRSLQPTIIEMSRQAHDLHINGGQLGKDFVYEIKDAKINTKEEMLRALVNDGNLLEKQYFYSVTKQNSLTEGNYKQVVEKLFDTTDTGTWLKKWNGQDYSPDKLKQYKEARKGDLDEYLEQLDAIKEFAGPDGEAAIKEGIRLYNYYSNQLRFESRETYRRLLVIIFGSIIPYQYQKDPVKKHNLSLFLHTQLGELYILTKKSEQSNPDGSSEPETITKIGFGPTRDRAMTYILPSEAQLQRLTEGLNQEMYNIGDESTQLIKERFRRSKNDLAKMQKSAQEIAGYKEQSREAKEQSREAKEQSREAKEQSKQAEEHSKLMKEESKRLQAIMDLSNRSLQLSDYITDQIKIYIKTPSGYKKEKLLSEIKKKLTEFDQLCKEAQKYSDDKLTIIISKSTELLDLWKGKAKV